MLLPDVNILVYAQREDLPAHASARNWLESALNGGELVALFNPTLASFLRIVTNRRIFKTPTPLPMALSFVETIRAAPATRALTTARTTGNFSRGCAGIQALSATTSLTRILLRLPLKTIASSSAWMPVLPAFRR